jgi:uncharacterized membrane protein YiaA
MDGNIQKDGVISGTWVFGHIVYSIVVYTVTLKVGRRGFFLAKWMHPI